MAEPELELYDVELHGVPTVVQLSRAHAARIGARKHKSEHPEREAEHGAGKPKPPDKARQAPNK